MKLHYQLWNQTQQQPQPVESTVESTKKLVLLHGMGGTGALWRPIASALENEFAILAPDQRGHGQSILPPVENPQASYTPLDYGQDIVETLAEAHFHPAWILGHSMGVRTAVAFAHLKPEWTQGLILVDLGFSGVAGGGLGEGLASFLKLLPLQFQSREEARDFMTLHCPDPSIAQYLMAVSVKTPEGGLTFPFDRSALIETIHSARDVSVRSWVQELGAQGVPILVLRGAFSQVWTHSEFEKEKAALSSFKSIVFQEVHNAGHGLPFEQRIVFIKLVRQFIRQFINPSLKAGVQ